MIALSYSRMKDMQCPFRFNALHIERSYKEPETPAMRIGSAVHQVMADYRRHCFKHGYETDIEWLRDAIDGEAHKALAALVEEERDEAIALAGGILDSELAKVPVFNTTSVMIEQKLAFNKKLDQILGKDAWFDKNVAFRCIADFSYVEDDTLYIVDDKTGWADPDPLQLGIYSYFVYRALPGDTFGINYIQTSFYDIRSKRVNLVSRIPADDPDRLAIPDIVKNAIKEVNSWKEFPAIPCDRCRFCSVPGCEHRDNTETALITADNTPVASIPTEITDKQQAEKAVMFVAFAEELVGKVKDLLREYVEKHGPVEAGGRVAELRANEPWKCTNALGLVKALISYGADKDLIWQNVSMSESALLKIIKKAGLEELKNVLSYGFGERKKYKPRFGIYKAKKNW